METQFSKKFLKKYHKLRQKDRDRFDQRLLVFADNPVHPALRNHALTGKYKGYRSINVTGDIRAIFKMIEENEAYFVDIDNHSNLYS